MDNRSFYIRSKANGGFSSGLVVKNLPANAGAAGDISSIPGSGRSPGGENGNPLQYSCLESPWTEEPGGLQSMGSHKSWTWLKWLLMHSFFAAQNLVFLEGKGLVGISSKHCHRRGDKAPGERAQALPPSPDGQSCHLLEVCSGS